MKELTVKEHTIKTLKDIIDAVQKEDWDALDRLTNISHAGDGYGDTNIYIDFTPHDNPYYYRDKLDIGDMADMIRCGNKFERYEEEDE